MTKVQCSECDQIKHVDDFASLISEGDSKDLCVDCDHEANGCDHSDLGSGLCMDCGACCEHQDLDHGICIDCGEDRSEWISMSNYDAYKASK